MTKAITAQFPIKELIALNFLASTDDAGSPINGVSIEATPDRLLMVSTDGRRLGVLKSAGNASGEFKATIRRQDIDLLQKNCGLNAQCLLELNGTELRLSLGILTINTKPVDGAFPNWRQVWPEPTKPSIHEAIYLNAEQQGEWWQVAEQLGGDWLRFGLFGELLPVEISIGKVPGFRGLQMPMRVPYESTDRPHWLKA